MKKQFVTYDIALKLKELGFDEECLCTYGKSDKRFMRNPGTNMIDEPVEDNPYYWQNSKVHESVICAPLWQQVIDWLREKYGFYVNIHQLFYSKYRKIAYFYSIESNVVDRMIYDYQNLYGDVLDASSQDVPGNHLNDELYDKNIFDMNFAYKTYEETREQAILKAIELCKNN